MKPFVKILVSLCGLFVTEAFANPGIMRPGVWEVSTLAEAIEGPGSRKPAGPNPWLNKACMAQTFVDKENYSNPDFSMSGPRRNGFECRVTSRTGDRSKASWSYECNRSDGFAIQEQMEVQIGDKTFSQVGSNRTTKGGELFSKVTIRVEGKHVSDQCGDGLLQLR